MKIFRKQMRLPGFEPEIVAWEATVIPLDYNRKLKLCVSFIRLHSLLNLRFPRVNIEYCCR